MGVLTGALALIKVRGQVIGRMQSIRYTENIRRQEVRGIGTIFASEAAAVEWTGQLTCDFFEITFHETGIAGAVKRQFANILSRVEQGLTSFEDQLVLDTDGIQIDIFKKVADVIDPTTRIIKPKLSPYATISSAMIESDGFTITDTSIAGHNQSFRCLRPIVLAP